MYRHITCSFFVFTALLLVCGNLIADQEEIDELRRRVERLERRLFDEDDESPGTFTGWEDNRFLLRSADEDYKLILSGHLHVDGRFPLSGPRAGRKQIFVPRMSVAFLGQVARYYEYRLEFEFGRGFGPAGEGASPRILDGFINFAFIDEAQLQVGRYKVPFSVDELISADYVRLVRRSIINPFAPSREVGATIHGDLGLISYAAGVFDSDSPDDFLYSGRVVFELSSILGGLSTGINGYYERNRGISLPPRAYGTLHTDLQTTYFAFADGAVSGGSRRAIGADAGYWGTPLGLMAEYLVFEQEAQIGEARDTITNHAWYVQASYVVTGEAATLRGVNPERPFDPAQGTWGAFELAARYAKVRVDSDAFPLFAAEGSAREAKVVTLGLNWYLNQFSRIMANYVYSRFSSSIDGDRSEDGILVRFQLDF